MNLAKKLRHSLPCDTGLSGIQHMTFATIFNSLIEWKVDIHHHTFPFLKSSLTHSSPSHFEQKENPRSYLRSSATHKGCSRFCNFATLSWWSRVAVWVTSERGVTVRDSFNRNLSQDCEDLVAKIKIVWCEWFEYRGGNIGGILFLRLVY